MHDIRWIRENPAEFDAALAKRGLDAISADLVQLDASRRAVQTELQELQTRRNDASKHIGIAKGKGEDADALIKEVGDLKDRMQALEEQEKALALELTDLLSGIPNLPADDTPAGAGEEDNVEIRLEGVPPVFTFNAKDHVELGENLSGINFERAGKLSGARFVVLQGAVARLERALASFMLDVQTGEYGLYRGYAPGIGQR